MLFAGELPPLGPPAALAGAVLAVLGAGAVVGAGGAGCGAPGIMDSSCGISSSGACPGGGGMGGFNPIPSPGSPGIPGSGDFTTPATPGGGGGGGIPGIPAPSMLGLPLSAPTCTFWDSFLQSEHNFAARNNNMYKHHPIDQALRMTCCSMTLPASAQSTTRQHLPQQKSRQFLE